MTGSITPSLPKAMLLDLDDTILDDSSTIEDCWKDACLEHRSDYSGTEPAELERLIRTTSRWFWGDADRHRIGRLDLDAARSEVVRLALAEIGIDNATLASKIGGVYSRERDLRMQPLPDAIDTVRWLRQSGCRLALLTNGAGPAQRRKLERFDWASMRQTPGWWATISSSTWRRRSGWACFPSGSTHAGTGCRRPQPCAPIASSVACRNCADEPHHSSCR
jgi:hypothetical protein